MVVGISIVVALIVLVVGGYLWMRATRTALCWFRQAPHRKASEDDIKVAIRALLDKQAFDNLFIYASPDPLAEGISFSSTDGELRLSMQFVVAKELASKQRCVEALAELGLEPKEELPWNEGMGPDLEMVTVEFPVVGDADFLYQVAEAALVARMNCGPGPRYLSALDLRDFPEREKGPLFVKDRDPLEDVLGPAEK